MLNLNRKTILTMGCLGLLVALSTTSYAKKQDYTGPNGTSPKVIPYIFNNSGSTLCYASSAYWGTYNVSPQGQSWPLSSWYGQGAPWVSYNVRGGNPGDCSDSAYYQGNISVTFNADGTYKSQTYSSSTGDTLVVQSRSNSECGESGSGIQCYMFLVNPT